MSSSPSVTPDIATAERAGLLTRVSDQMRQLVCGLKGHDMMLHFEPHRVSLRCVSCGHESPGWEVATAPPQPIEETKPATATTPAPATPRLRLVSDRRRVA